MLIQKGDKIHLTYRALYAQSTRRHFLGEVIECEGVVCVLLGYAFIFDPKLETYVRKPEKRKTVVDLSESGYVVNIIDSGVNIVEVAYKYSMNSGMVATDGKNFSLDINEFGLRS